LTIIALLNHSLANLRRRSTQLSQRKNHSCINGSYGLWAPLVAARTAEADVLVSGYVPRPDDAAAGEPVRQHENWAFHR
jgi:hypothetical protein